MSDLPGTLHASCDACTCEPDLSVNSSTDTWSVSGDLWESDFAAIRDQLLSKCSAGLNHMYKVPEVEQQPFVIGVLIRAWSIYPSDELVLSYFGSTMFTGSCINTHGKTSMHHMQTCKKAETKKACLSTSAMILAWYCPSSVVNCA